MNPHRTPSDQGASHSAAHCPAGSGRLYKGAAWARGAPCGPGSSRFPHRRAQFGHEDSALVPWAPELSCHQSLNVERGRGGGSSISSQLTWGPEPQTGRLYALRDGPGSRSLVVISKDAVSLLCSGGFGGQWSQDLQAAPPAVPMRPLAQGGDFRVGGVRIPLDAEVGCWGRAGGCVLLASESWRPAFPASASRRRWAPPSLGSAPLPSDSLPTSPHPGPPAGFQEAASELKPSVRVSELLPL